MPMSNSNARKALAEQTAPVGGISAEERMLIQIYGDEFIRRLLDALEAAEAERDQLRARVREIADSLTCKGVHIMNECLCDVSESLIEALRSDS